MWWIVVYIWYENIYMMYDRLAGWWIIDYIMLGFYYYSSRRRYPDSTVSLKSCEGRLPCSKSQRRRRFIQYRWLWFKI